MCPHHFKNEVLYTLKHIKYVHQINVIFKNNLLVY